MSFDITFTGDIKSRRNEWANGTERVRIVAVTALQEMDFRAGAKAAGFDAYLN